MSGCVPAAYSVVAALASINSEHTGHFAKVVEMICKDCDK